MTFERIYIDEIEDIIGNTKKSNEYMQYEDLTWYKGKIISLIYTFVQTDKPLEYNNSYDLDKVLKSLANKFSSYKDVTITYIESMNKEECEDYILQLERSS